MTVLNEIAKIQQEVTRLKKTTKGYNYMYMDLASLLEELLPLMKKHNLGWTANFTTASQVVGDVLYQEYRVSVYSTEPADNTLDIFSSNYMVEVGRPQNTGTQETYYRRYALLSMFGLATVDDDAASMNKDYVKPDMSGTGEAFE